MKEKLENVKIEMERNGLNLLGLGDDYWSSGDKQW